jgi:hypothetical protein
MAKRRGRLADLALPLNIVIRGTRVLVYIPEMAALLSLSKRRAALPKLPRLVGKAIRVHYLICEDLAFDLRGENVALEPLFGTNEFLSDFIRPRSWNSILFLAETNVTGK